MQSLFWAAAIYGGISLWLTYLKREEKENRMWLRCLAGYLFSRLFIWIQLRHLSAISAAAWIVDAVLFGSSMFLAERCWNGFSWKQVWLYLTNPIVFLSLSSLKKMTAVAVILFTVLILMKKWKTGEKDLTPPGQEQITELYHYYIAFTVCGMLYLMARLLLGQSGIQCVSGDGAYPMLWLLAVELSVLTAIGFLLFFRRLCIGKYKAVHEECVKEGQTGSQTRFAAAAEGKGKRKERFSGKDWVFLLLFTLVYAGIVFFRLGSAEAPQSFLKLSSASEQEREIVLQFEEETELTKLELFLGVQSNRTFSFSEYDVEKEEWEVFDSKRKIKSVFTWNTIPVDRTVRAIALVSMDAEAYIHELVCLDSAGNRVLPVNWQEYEALFDEQELYPDNVTYYEGTMFDEVYHARTAYEFVHRLPLYEITHPPLGKLMMSLGIRLFGMTPFGWRIVCALYGIAMVPLMYLFVRRLTGQRKLTVFAAALFCFEFMHLTLSRIATLDIIVAYFVLGMFFFMYLSIAALRKAGLTAKAAAYLFLSGGFSACAVAVKWTGFYALAGIGILLLGYVFWGDDSSGKRLIQNRALVGKLFCVCTAAFVFLPAVVYFASYIPYTWCGNQDSFVKIAIDNSIQMLRYHQKTVFDHPYSSEWYEWIWNKRPLLDALRRVDGGKVSSVATFGNPIIWWGGLAAFLHNVYLWRCRKEETAAYLCIAYLSMLLPWLFIYRTVFIYQYFICSNLLILLIANSFAHMEHHQNQRLLGFCAAAGLVFIAFFPVLSGYPVSADYINHGLEWLQSWTFA